ncbi:MAG TPA: glycosyltransferase [Gammaproteobacteria bacterium]|nr:glycosyltransferase [Gammaproteobacteria bacterium]
MSADRRDARQPPRVLIVIGQLDVGGAERHVAQIAPALRARGIDVSIFTLKPGGALAAAVAAAGVPVLAHLERKRGLRGLLQAALRLAGLARRERYDIVHFFLPAAYLVGVCATWALPVRRVMSRRSLARYQARYPGVRLLERLLHRRMDCVLANSRAVARELATEGMPLDRLGLVYNGVIDRTQGIARDAARAALRLPADVLVFAMIANLIPYKGHGDLLHALAQASARLPSGWTMLLVGRDDGIGLSLREEARRLRLDGHLRWLGALDDVGPVLAAADIGVLCSHEEGFSNAVLEGMAAGLPMIVTDVGGNAEAVIDGVCGRVIPAHVPAALAAALTELAASPADRARMGEAARARAAQSFTVEACVAQYELLYRNLVAGVTPPLPPAAFNI